MLGGLPEDNGLTLGLMLLAALPLFLCFILLRSDETNVGDGLVFWASVTLISLVVYRFDKKRRT